MRSLRDQMDGEESENKIKDLKWALEFVRIEKERAEAIVDLKKTSLVRYEENQVVNYKQRIDLCSQITYINSMN